MDVCELGEVGWKVEGSFNAYGIFLGLGPQSWDKKIEIKQGYTAHN